MRITSISAIWITLIAMIAISVIDETFSQDFGEATNNALRLHNEKCEDDRLSISRRAKNCIWAGEIYEEVGFYPEALGRYNQACNLAFPKEKKYCKHIGDLLEWLVDTSGHVIYKNYPATEIFPPHEAQ